MICIFTWNFWLHNAITTGIISSIMASFVFLFLIFCLRPRVTISEHLARYVDKDGNKIFLFKIINRSYFKIVDLQTKMLILTPIGTYGGNNLKIEYLKLKTDKIWYLDRRNNFFKKSEHATFAIIFSCLDDLDAIWNHKNGSILHIEVICKHGLSGFNKVITRNYHSDTEIKNGYYKYGNSTEIVSS